MKIICASFVLNLAIVLHCWVIILIIIIMILIFKKSCELHHFLKHFLWNRYLRIGILACVLYTPWWGQMFNIYFYHIPCKSNKTSCLIQTNILSHTWDWICIKIELKLWPWLDFMFSLYMLYIFILHYLYVVLDIWRLFLLPESENKRSKP